MQIHPAIAALRNDRSEQFAMQEQFESVSDEWYKLKQVGAISDDLQSYADGVILGDCMKLDPLMSNPIISHEFVQTWQNYLIRALREYPLGLPSFGSRSSSGLSHIVLLNKGNASLGIAAYEERSEKKLPLTAVFSDLQTVEIVISGSADGVLHEVRQCNGLDTIIDTCTVHWRPGAIIVTNGPCEARQVVSVDGAMVVLQLSRKAANPQPTREYSLHDGELMQSASGNKRASQKVMALSVLGAMALQDEAPDPLNAMLICADDLAEDADVRWEAVRQVLAIDAAQGISLLEGLATRAYDPLSLPALDLRDVLRTDRPELAHLFGSTL